MLFNALRFFLYSSCCVDAVAAMHVQGEAVVHYGRSCFTKSDIPVFTVLPKGVLDLHNIKLCLLDNFNTDKDNKLCLFYDAEFEHCKGIFIDYFITFVYHYLRIKKRCTYKISTFFRWFSKLLVPAI